MKMQKNNQKHNSEQSFDATNNSVSLSNCEYLNDETLSEPQFDDAVEYTSALIPFTTEDEERLLLAMSLAIDIFTDPDAAQWFSTDPTMYMANRNLEYEGSLDYGILQMVLAFADGDIRQAIEEHNIEDFITLCQDRGIFAIPFGLEDIDADEFRRALEEAGVSPEDTDVIVECYYIIPVAAVVFVVAAIFVAIAASVESAIELHAAIFLDTAVALNGYDTYTDMSELNPSPLALWMTREGDYTADQIVLNEVAENYYTQIDTYLSNHSTQYVSDDNYRDCIQRLIKSNLVHALME